MGNSSSKWFQRLNIAKISILPKLITTIPVKISGGIFNKIEKLNPKFIWKWKGHRIAKTTLKKEQNCQTNTTDLETYYYKVLIMKTAITDRHDVKVNKQINGTE